MSDVHLPVLCDSECLCGGLDGPQCPYHRTRHTPHSTATQTGRQHRRQGLTPTTHQHRYTYNIIRTGRASSILSSFSCREVFSCVWVEKWVPCLCLLCPSLAELRVLAPPLVQLPHDVSGRGVRPQHGDHLCINQKRQLSQPYHTQLWGYRKRVNAPPSPSAKVRNTIEDTSKATCAIMKVLRSYGVMVFCYHERLLRPYYGVCGYLSSEGVVAGLGMTDQQHLHLTPTLTHSHDMTHSTQPGRRRG